MFLTLTSLAFAYQVQTVPGTDTPVFWPRMPLEYTFIDDVRLPPGGGSAVTRAFDVWADVEGTRADFKALADLGALPVVDFDADQVVFMPEEWPYGEQALAISSVWTNDKTGEMMHFDIRINPQVDWAVDGDVDCFDLESAVTHEVGHVLGLEHSVLEEATMFAVLAPGQQRGGLHEDDEAGLLFLYPEHDEEAAASCSTAPGTAGWLGLGLVALGFRRGGRR